MKHPAKPLLLVALFLSSLLAVFATAIAQDLPPQVAFDRLKRKILDAYSVHDERGTLELIERMHTLESDDLRMPPAILFVEADFSAATGQYVRAKQALQAYFNSGENKGDRYERALRLLDVIEPKAAEEAKRAAVAAKLAVEEQRILKNIEICDHVLSYLNHYDGTGNRTFAKARSNCPPPANSLVPQAHPQYARMVAIQDAMEARFMNLSRTEAQQVLANDFIHTNSAPIGVVNIPAGDLKLKDGRTLHSSGFRITDRVLGTGFSVSADFGFCHIRGYLHLADPTFNNGEPQNFGACPQSNQQVVAFVAWLSKATGRKFRLPTEEEWEYAVRGGIASNYPWGERVSGGKAAKYFEQRNAFGVSGDWIRWPQLTLTCSAQALDGVCEGPRYAKRNGSTNGSFGERESVSALSPASWFHLVEM